MMDSTCSQLFTIGHSNHDYEAFVALLKMHGVTAIADVRSSPYSRWSPQFSQRELKHSLGSSGIAYSFLGKEFGARSDDPECYVDGKVQYSRLAELPAFANGVARIREGLKSFRIALMCAEKDPIDCHRAVLVSRELQAVGFEVMHILSDGVLQSHLELEQRLVAKLKLPPPDLLEMAPIPTDSEVLDLAYRKQESKIAYQDEQMLRQEDGG